MQIQSSQDYTEIVHVTDDIENAGEMKIRAENTANWKFKVDISPPEFLVDMPVYLGCFRDVALNNTGTTLENEGTSSWLS